jgi:hypothetical protein
MAKEKHTYRHGGSYNFSSFCRLTEVGYTKGRELVRSGVFKFVELEPGLRRFPDSENTHVLGRWPEALSAQTEGRSE